jgi:hypothetical protein
MRVGQVDDLSVADAQRVVKIYSMQILKAYIDKTLKIVTKMVQLTEG